MTRRHFLTGATVLMLIVAACDGTDTRTTTEVPTTTEAAVAITTTPPTTTSTTTTTIPPPGINTRYQSVFDMREAVEEGGFSCSPWTLRGASLYSIESAECTPDYIFAVYENASLVKEQREFSNPLMFILYDTIYNLEGPNWSVWCSDDPNICERFLSLLGGEIIVSTKP